MWHTDKSESEPVILLYGHVIFLYGHVIFLYGHVILLYSHDVNYDEIMQLIGESIVVVFFLNACLVQRRCNCTVSISE